MDYNFKKEGFCHQFEFNWMGHQRPSRYLTFLIRKEIPLEIYCNHNWFGIANLFQDKEESPNWSIIHLPSRTVILADLNKKSEAIFFLQILSGYINLASLELVNSDYDQIRKLLDPVLKQTYPNFIFQMQAK